MPDEDDIDALCAREDVSIGRAGRAELRSMIEAAAGVVGDAR